MIKHRSIDSVLPPLYDTVLDPMKWDVAIAMVAAYFEAPSATIFNYDFTTSLAYDFRTHGFDPAVAERYTNYYCRFDPGRSTAMAAGIGDWVADEPLLDTKSPRDQEYVHDFALPGGIGWVGGVKIMGDATTCTWLSVIRRPGANRFGNAAKLKYRALEPHLRRVSQMASGLESVATRNTLAHACLDRLSIAVMVVDNRRRIHLVNAKGAAMLGVGWALSTSNGVLRAATPSADEQLGHVIHDACAHVSKGAALRIARSESTQPLLVSVVPIPGSHELASLVREPLALVAISDPDASVMSVGIYRALFALTTAEASLLEALVAGIALGAWARQRGVSVNTARSQLCSLFEKTGTDSQARLVALAKSIAPVG